MLSFASVDTANHKTDVGLSFKIVVIIMRSSNLKKKLKKGK
jgi:hypothetical protein